MSNTKQPDLRAEKTDLDQERERWTHTAQYFEYTKAANPIAAGLISNVPFAAFPAHLHEEGPTRIIPFDLSEQLRCSSPATTPALCANFIRILAGERIETRPNATSEVYYVIRGRGRTRLREGELPWHEGDFFSLPGGGAVHHADEGAAFYWVHDEPLLRYLGAKLDTPRFEPTLYPSEKAKAELAEIWKDPEAASRSRISVLLADEKFDQTRTITQVMWTMFGVLPGKSVQLPHRHEAVALDYIIDCEPGSCYTLIGPDIDKDGKIVDAMRADWKPGAAFVTPPGQWHAHYNESDTPAHLIPMQDAGLHTYLRTLDIKFYHPRGV